MQFRIDIDRRGSKIGPRTHAGYSFSIDITFDKEVDPRLTFLSGLSNILLPWLLQQITPRPGAPETSDGFNPNSSPVDDECEDIGHEP